MRPYLGPPWTNSCQIWCVRVFHHVLLKYCHENAEMQKRKFDDVTLQYSITNNTEFFVCYISAGVCMCSCLLVSPPPELFDTWSHNCGRLRIQQFYRNAKYFQIGTFTQWNLAVHINTHHTTWHTVSRKVHSL